MRQTMNGGDWLRLGGLALLWGGSFLFYRVLALQLPPLSIACGRTAIGGAVLIAALRLRGVAIAVPRDQWRGFLVLGLLNNAIPFTLFAWGETRVLSGTAAILNATTPLFTVLVAGLVWRSEKLTALRLLGVTGGIAGVAVLVGPRAVLGQDLLGEMACLLAALTYGFALPYGRRIRGVAPSSMAAGQLIASTLILAPLTIAFDRPWSLPAPDLAGWGALLGIAVLSTAAALLGFFDLLARAGAGNLALVTLLVPVFALLLGALVLHEPITRAAVLGMALIGLGMAVSGGLLRLTRKVAAHSPP